MECKVYYGITLPVQYVQSDTTSNDGECTKLIIKAMTKSIYQGVLVPVDEPRIWSVSPPPLLSPAEEPSRHSSFPPTTGRRICIPPKTKLSKADPVDRQSNGSFLYQTIATTAHY